MNQGQRQGFETFWILYPRKHAKLDAIKAWEKLSPDLTLMQWIIHAVEEQKASVDWIKEDGQFVPLPATWLRGGRWMDEIRTERRRFPRSSYWQDECPHTPKCGNATNCEHLKAVARYRAEKAEREGV